MTLMRVEMATPQKHYGRKCNQCETAIAVGEAVLCFDTVAYVNRTERWHASCLEQLASAAVAKEERTLKAKLVKEERILKAKLVSLRDRYRATA